VPREYRRHDPAIRTRTKSRQHPTQADLSPDPVFCQGRAIPARPVSVLREASGKPKTTAAIACAIVAAKGFPVGEGTLSEAVTDMTLTVLRRLCKRETVVKSGTTRNAQWALAPSLL
jgi:hypothetical protein